MSKEIDFTNRRWGHNLTTITDDIYECICTPGPEVGDIAIAPDKSRWKFTKVEWLENPRDLYHVGLEKQS